MLRASRIQWDLRKMDNYECYEEFDRKVQWQKEGDSLARYLVVLGSSKYKNTKVSLSKSF